MMSKKRLGLIFLGIALIAVTGITALSQTWVSATATMHLTESASTANLKVYWDCGALNPTTDIDWGPVTSGQTYVRSLFVLNTGTVALKVYYLPTWYQNAQYKFHIECFVVKDGTKCQLYDIAKTQMLEKTDYPTPGYDLPAGTMIKVDVYLTVDMIEVATTYSFEFGFHGFYA
jgi:hypothetical protein